MDGNTSARCRRAFLQIGSFAHSTEGKHAPALFSQAAHQVQDGINDSPRQIASQRTHEHDSDFGTTGPGNTERTREGEHHDQSEENLRHPVNRFEDALRGLDRAVNHGPAGRVAES